MSTKAEQLRKAANAYCSAPGSSLGQELVQIALEVADHLDAPSAPFAQQSAQVAVPTQDQITDAVKMAMQDTWNDWCTDTDCHPDDIRKHKGGKLEFVAGAWAEYVGEWLYSYLYSNADTPSFTQTGLIRSDLPNIRLREYADRLDAVVVSDERFQNETRRTSELHRLVRKFIDTMKPHVTSSFHTDWKSLIQEAEELLARPINLEAVMPDEQTKDADTERLNWLASNPFTLYRNRDPDGAMFQHFTLVAEDRKPRRGIVNGSLRSAIDEARAIAATPPDGSKV